MNIEPDEMRSWAKSQPESGMCSLSNFDARLAAIRQPKEMEP
jgi:hypothetical protein